MTKLEVPQLRVDVPTRADALLEVIQQPLYSAVAFDAAVVPFSTEAFSYRIGQTVAGVGAGAIAATINQTNMTQSGTLAFPKVAEFRQIRQVICPLTPALVAPITPTLNADATDVGAIWLDTKNLTWGTWLRFHVGEKDYVTAPSFLTPANTGIGGSAAVSVFDTAGAEQQIVALPNSAGRGFSFVPYSIFLPSQQQFFAQIRASQPTPPTLTAAMLVWIILDSVIGREVM